MLLLALLAAGLLAGQAGGAGATVVMYGPGLEAGEYNVTCHGMVVHVVTGPAEGPLRVEVRGPGDPLAILSCVLQAGPGPGGMGVESMPAQYTTTRPATTSSVAETTRTVGAEATTATRAPPASTEHWGQAERLALVAVAGLLGGLAAFAAARW